MEDRPRAGQLSKTLTAAAPGGITPPAWRRRAAAAGESWNRWWFAYAMLVPVLVVIALIVFYPLGRGIWLTLTNANAANIGDFRRPATYDFVGLRNYIEVLSGQRRTATGQSFWTVGGRTVVWTAVNVFFHYTIGLALAVVLNRPLRFRALYRILLLIPWALPAYITASSWRFLFNEQAGPFNLILATLGLDPVAWLGNPTMALASVIAVNVWLGVPFMIVALLGGLQSIPGDLYEAAEVDGASPWQRFRHITMPLLRPISATVILLGVIWTFNMFVIIFLITQGGPAGKTEILVTFAFNEAFTNPTRQFALASTYGVLILSILLVFASAYQRVLRRSGENPW